MKGGDKITEPKKTTRAKRVKRTPQTLALVNANRFVRHLISVTNEAKALKSRINELPASDFSEIAIGFNNVLSDHIPQLSEQIFTVTEKEHVDSPEPEPETSFSDYMTQPTKPEIPESDNEGE